MTDQAWITSCSDTGLPRCEGILRLVGRMSWTTLAPVLADVNTLQEEIGHQRQSMRRGEVTGLTVAV